MLTQFLFEKLVTNAKNLGNLIHEQDFIHIHSTITCRKIKHAGEQAFQEQIAISKVTFYAVSVMLKIQPFITGSKEKLLIIHLDFWQWKNHLERIYLVLINITVTASQL